MITLNILPIELKKELKLKLIYKILKNLFLICIILICIYGIIITVIKIFLQIHFINTVEETTLITRSTQNYSKKVYDINIKLNEVENIQENSINWSYLIAFIANNLASDIKLNRLQLAKDGKNLVLSGFSSSRQSLLDLKNALESSSYFTEVNFPISNLLEKKDITFEISANINAYDFEKLFQNK